MSVEAARIYATVGVNGLSSFASGMSAASGIVESTGRRMEAFGARATAVGSALTRHITLPIVGIAAAAIHMGLNFEQQMRLVQTQAGGSARDVKVLSQEVLNLAKSTTQGPEELAKAMFHLKSLGLDNATAMGVLKQASRGAMTGIADLEETTNALGGAVRVGIKGTENYSRAMGILNATVGAGNMRMEDLVNALGTGLLPTAKLAGLSLRDVGAAMAVFTDENVPAEQAATRLRTSLMMMQAPSAKAETAMEGLGFTSQKIGDMIRSPKGFVGTIQMIGKKYDEAKKKLGDTQAFALMARAFGGSKTAATIMTLVNNMAMLGQKYKQIGKTADNFNKDVAASSQTNMNKIKTAWSSVQVALVKLGGALAPVVTELATALGKLADAFAGLSPHTQHLIVIIAGIAAALGPIVGLVGTVATVFGAFATVVGVLLSPVGLLVAGVVLLAGAMIAAEVAPDKLAAGLQRLGMSAGTARGVVDGLRTAFGILKTTLESVFNGVVTVIGGDLRIIGDLIGLVADLLTGRWGAAWNRMKDIVSTAVGIVTGLVRNMVTTVVGIWNSFSDSMKIAALKVALFMVEPFSHLPGALGGWARRAKTALEGEISQVRLDALNRTLSGQLSAIGGAMTRRAGGTGADLGHAVSTHAQASTNLGGMSSKIRGGIASARAANVGAAAAAGQAIGAAMSEGMAAGIGAAAAGVAAAAAATVSNAIAAAKAAARSHSPSLETMQKVGLPMAQGIAVGLLAGGPMVNAASAHVVQDGTKAATHWAQIGGRQAGIAFAKAYSSITSNLHGLGPGGQPNIPVGMQIAETQAELVGDIPGQISALQGQAVYLSNLASETKPGTQQYLDVIQSLLGVNQQIQQLTGQLSDAKSAVDQAADTYNQSPTQENQTALDQAVAAMNALNNPAVNLNGAAGATVGPSVGTLSGGGTNVGGSDVGDVYLDSTKVGEIVRRDLLRTQSRNGSPVLG